MNGGEIPTTGEVEAKSQVELKSQVSAKVNRVNVSLGQFVSTGQTLVGFENGDVFGSFLQAEANLESQLALLAELEGGARDEQLNLAQAATTNAQNGLDSTTNANVTNLNNAYLSGLSAAQSAITTARSTLFSITNLQNAHFADYSQEAVQIAEKKQFAIDVLFGEPDAGRWQNQFISTLDGGVFGDINQLASTLNPNQPQTDVVLQDALRGVRMVKDLIEFIPTKATFTSAQTADLVAQRSAMNGALASLTGAVQGIQAQKAGNASALVQAQSALDTAQNQLDLTVAGAADEQITAQRARVKSARGAYTAASAQLSKTTIRAPFSGEVAALDVRVGELVAPGQRVASVVNTTGLQITAFIDARDLGALKSGDKALIKESIEGTVANVAPSIDSNTKKVEVIITVNADSDTSNLVVGDFVNVKLFPSRESGENSYRLPLQAVKVIADQGFVYTVSDENVVEEREVVLGRVIGESVEVISGLNGDDTILQSIRGINPGETVDVTGDEAI